MLELKKIIKTYKTGDTIVDALKSVNITFRDSEFVSILGPSGCGKTTLLNIVGGLDKYTSGNLIIEGISTKDYKARDWDTYRNHKIGFVFQSYNLISHQNVLSNVELALTLSGVSKTERRKKAKEALEKVGLGDQLHKKPNQMSGGQMQRVAIARAIINDPDILLADEPTGALDTETSIQIMELLKEIAKDRLVIMVTHNPELAENYSSRIIRLKDGQVISDSKPIDEEERKTLQSKVDERNEALKDKKGRIRKEKKPSMSVFTALSLSFNNLLTKKARTLLTAFAGSIGIIGIALILSLSSGVNNYIDRVQKDTLSSYPITIDSVTFDSSEMTSVMTGKTEDIDYKDDKIYAQSMMVSVMDMTAAGYKENNLTKFKEFLDSDDNGLEPYVSSISYKYDIPINIYSADTEDGVTQVNPNVMFTDLMSNLPEASAYSAMMNSDVWTQIYTSDDLMKEQYQLVSGSWAKEYNEAVLMVDENNCISDFTLYSLDIMDQDELDSIMQDLIDGKEVDTTTKEFDIDEILGKTFKLVLPTDYYQYNEDTKTWTDISGNQKAMKDVVDNGLEIKIVGIIKPNEEAVSGASVNGLIGYTSALQEYIINEVNDSEIVKWQLDNPDTDVFTGIEFDKDASEITMDDVNAYMATLSEEEQAGIQQYLANMSEEDILTLFGEQLQAQTTDATYEGNLEILGVADTATPDSIEIYAKDFEAKDSINEIIDDYNDSQENEDDEIEYTDYVALLMSSVTTIINAISYILIAFVAISLIVSSIMIGIITYISVLERTKEIGILRSIGASKKDIRRVFNAETFIVGLVAGLIGIGITLLLLIPINAIIKSITDIANLAALPTVGGVILVVISVVLTLIAGLFPSSVAAKKDPVEALRTE